MFRKAPAMVLFMLLSAVHPPWAMAAPDQGPLRIVYTEFPPFHALRPDGRMEGIFHDILVEALTKRMGLQLTWTAYPWMRCQNNLKNGEADAILTVPTAERAVYTTTHKQPFFEKPLHLFTASDHPRRAAIMQIKTLADIKDMGLSVITYSGNGWHNDHVRSLGIKTLETAFLGNVWPMLVRHRGDLVIEWPQGAAPELQRHGIKDKIIDTGIVIAKMPFFLLVRKNSEHVPLLDRFDATIDKMAAEGVITAILNRYQ